MDAPRTPKPQPPPTERGGFPAPVNKVRKAKVGEMRKKYKCDEIEAKRRATMFFHLQFLGTLKTPSGAPEYPPDAARRLVESLYWTSDMPGMSSQAADYVAGTHEDMDTQTNNAPAQSNDGLQLFAPKKDNARPYSSAPVAQVDHNVPDAQRRAYEDKAMSDSTIAPESIHSRPAVATTAPSAEARVFALHKQLAAKDEEIQEIQDIVNTKDVAIQDLNKKLSHEISEWKRLEDFLGIDTSNMEVGVNLVKVFEDLKAAKEAAEQQNSAQYQELWAAKERISDLELDHGPNCPDRLELDEQERSYYSLNEAYNKLLTASLGGTPALIAQIQQQTQLIHEKDEELNQAYEQIRQRDRRIQLLDFTPQVDATSQIPADAAQEVQPLTLQLDQANSDKARDLEELKALADREVDAKNATISELETALQNAEKAKQEMVNFVNERAGKAVKDKQDELTALKRNAREALDRKNGDIQNLNSEINSKNATITEMNSQYNSLSEEKTFLQQNLSSTQSQVTELQAQLSRLDSVRVENLMAEGNSLMKSLADKNREYQSLDTEYQNTANQLALKISDFDKVVAENKSLFDQSQRLQSANEELTALKEEADATAKSFEGIKDRLEHIVSLETANTALQSKVASLEAAKESSDSNIASLKADKKASASLVASLEAAKKNLEAEKAQLNTTAESLKQSLMSNQTQLREAMDQAEKCKAKSENLATRLDQTCGEFSMYRIAHPEDGKRDFTHGFNMGLTYQTEHQKDVLASIKTKEQRNKEQNARTKIVLESAQDRARNLKWDLDSSMDREDQLKDELAKSRSECAEAREEGFALRKEKRSLTQQLKDMDKDFQIQSNQSKSKSNKVQSLERDLKTLQEEHQEFIDKLSHLEASDVADKASIKSLSEALLTFQQASAPPTMTVSIPETVWEVTPDIEPKKLDGPKIPIQKAVAKTDAAKKTAEARSVAAKVASVAPAVPSATIEKAAVKSDNSSCSWKLSILLLLAVMVRMSFRFIDFSPSTIPGQLSLPEAPYDFSVSIPSSYGIQSLPDALSTGTGYESLVYRTMDDDVNGIFESSALPTAAVSASSPSPILPVDIPTTTAISRIYPSRIEYVYKTFNTFISGIQTILFGVWSRMPFKSRGPA